MKSNQKTYVRSLCTAGLIAALYVALTLISAALGLHSGAIQLRLSEALCVLPLFTPAAIPGLAVGCLLANALTGSLLPDVLLGSLATLIGAVGTRLLRRLPWPVALVPPILANALIVPAVLITFYGLEGTYGFFFLTVGAGELISVGLFGTLLYTALRKRNVW